MKNSRDLILGEVVYMSILYRIPDSLLYSLNGYDFSVDHMTGENREYSTLVITEYEHFILFSGCRREVDKRAGEPSTRFKRSLFSMFEKWPQSPRPSG